MDNVEVARHRFSTLPPIQTVLCFQRLSEWYLSNIPRALARVLEEYGGCEGTPLFSVPCTRNPPTGLPGRGSGCVAGYETALSGARHSADRKNKVIFEKAFFLVGRHRLRPPFEAQITLAFFWS